VTRTKHITESKKNLKNL